jgi:hypothetical protein
MDGDVTNNREKGTSCKNASAPKIRYQETFSEDTAGE